MNYNYKILGAMEQFDRATAKALNENRPDDWFDPVPGAIRDVVTECKAVEDSYCTLVAAVFEPISDNIDYWAEHFGEVELAKKLRDVIGLLSVERGVGNWKRSPKLWIALDVASTMNMEFENHNRIWHILDDICPDTIMEHFHVLAIATTRLREKCIVEFEHERDAENKTYKETVEGFVKDMSNIVDIMINAICDMAE